MLFNAYDFLFGFLPVCLLGHTLALRFGGRAAMAWLVGASLFFYGWWYAPYLLLLLASMAVNYGLGVRLGRDRPEAERKRWLTVGILFDLGLLAWFKYANFLAGNVEALFGVSLGLPPIALPLAISFFTFQQVAYLVDAYKGLTRAHDVLDYALFVSFFPQLVAGPIVHHGEMLPQFAKGRSPDSTDRAVGMTMFAMGLAKKVLVADSLATTTDTVFAATAAGHHPTLAAAWTGVLSYHFQLYFDFSGYSDMAIGLARLFGIKLPANFDAPYRANHIGEFWRRWHMTLSRFLRDYIYIPLGGNRKGENRRYLNLFITMLLGGLWHGAGWTYVIWGGLHGVYLVVQQHWAKVTGGLGDSPRGVFAARTITWLAVLAGWPLFRSADMETAGRILGAMIGQSPRGLGTVNLTLLVVFAALFWFTQRAPTLQRWMEDHEPVLTLKRADEVRWSARWMWQPTAFWAIVVGLIAFLTIPLLERADAFLYWNF